MEARLILVPDEEEKDCGVVKPVVVIGGVITYGLSIGNWTLLKTDNRIHITLYEDVTTIIHETATSKAVAAELRAAEKDANGVEKKTVVTLDPRTKRFKEEYL